MENYIVIFKCRLCGETFENGCTTGKKVAEKAVVSASMGERSEPLAPTLYDVHYCDDGSFGIADFIGIKMEEE